MQATSLSRQSPNCSRHTHTPHSHATHTRDTRDTRTRHTPHTHTPHTHATHTRTPHTHATHTHTRHTHTPHTHTRHTHTRHTHTRHTHADRPARVSPPPSAHLVRRLSSLWVDSSLRCLSASAASPRSVTCTPEEDSSPAGSVWWRCTSMASSGTLPADSTRPGVLRLRSNATGGDRQTDG